MKFNNMTETQSHFELHKQTYFNKIKDICLLFMIKHPSVIVRVHPDKLTLDMLRNYLFMYDFYNAANGGQILNIKWSLDNLLQLKTPEVITKIYENNYPVDSRLKINEGLYNRVSAVDVSLVLRCIEIGQQIGSINAVKDISAFKYAVANRYNLIEYSFVFNKTTRELYEQFHDNQSTIEEEELMMRMTMCLYDKDLLHD